MQQLPAFTHKGQMRVGLHAAPSVLVGEAALIRAEVEAFASEVELARRSDLGTLPGHRLCGG